jgi:hypothetical protein
LRRTLLFADAACDTSKILRGTIKKKERKTAEAFGVLLKLLWILYSEYTASLRKPKPLQQPTARRIRAKEFAKSDSKAF